MKLASVRQRLVGLCIAIVALVAADARAAPCAGFTDVDDTSPFCENVQWLRNRAITVGCTSTLYCPDQVVTRLAMAAFLNRFANAVTPLADGGIATVQPYLLTANPAFALRCTQSEIVVGDSPMTAHGHGVVMVRGTGGWAEVGVAFAESTDGVNFANVSPVQMVRAEDGELSTVAVILPPRALAAGGSYRYSLRVLRVGGGTTSQGEVGCEVKLIYENRNPTLPPFDVGP